jgi:hypothetical protein
MMKIIFSELTISDPKTDSHSSMTVFAEANVDVDLRMLRSFRVLRPLKLVSRIPSKRSPKNLKIFSLDDISLALTTDFSYRINLDIPNVHSVNSFQHNQLLS